MAGDSGSIGRARSKVSRRGTKSIAWSITRGFDTRANAINREKQIKGLDRTKRVALIESMNPTWEDLSLEWGQPIELLHAGRANEKQIPRGLKPARDDNSEMVAIKARSTRELAGVSAFRLHLVKAGSKILTEVGRPADSSRTEVRSE